MSEGRDGAMTDWLNPNPFRPRAIGAEISAPMRLRNPVDLESLEELELQKTFQWLTRTGAGRHFGSVPIGWYQQHQMAAIDVLVERARELGVEKPQMFRMRRGEYQASDGRKWIKLGLDGRQVFHAAERRIR